LKGADEVLVVAVTESGRSASVADVAEYLAAHAVKARTLSLEFRDMSVADEILKPVDTEMADLLVAGAYGHTRVREWILGGVSRDLLDHTPVCTILSH
jgi:nucleotide-binding universal stress UspA family protein